MTIENINRININEIDIVDKIKDRSLDEVENPLDFARLKQSIKENGLFNPLIFARLGDDKLELLCGRRRLKALRGLSKEDEKFANVECKIYGVDTSREQRNIIAFSDNQHRKDLNNELKFYPLYLLVIAKFYNIDSKSILEGNIIENVKDDKLFEYLKNIDISQPNNDATYNYIATLSNQINVDIATLLAEFCKISALDYNVYMMKRQNENLSIKKLLKFKNSTNQTIKTLYAEVNKTISLLLQKEIDCEKINEISKSRFDLECSVQNKSEIKAFFDKILSLYYSEMQKCANTEKEKTKQNTSLKEIKSFLKGANDSEIEQILEFIKQMKS